MWSFCKKTACRLDSVQAPRSGSPLQAARAAEVDTGLGSGGVIDGGTGCGSVAGKGGRRGAVQQKKQAVGETENKTEVGDTAD